MKYLLIAVYLAHGSQAPTTQTRLYESKEACQSTASKYVAGVIVGQARAFCLKVKE